jgi:GNAT superfamily N-acetyltransferase
MKLVQVSDKKSAAAFFDVPRAIYATDKNYIPPIQQDIEKIFNPTKNKLYKLGAEAERWVLFNENNRPIGRVAAFINPKTVNSGEHAVGGMGFFECIDNDAAATLLMNTSKEWLIQRGMKGMDGPVNFGERDQFWGLLTDNFTGKPSYGMNYNPAYYQRFFENFGFKIYFKQLVFWRDLRVPPQDVFVKKAELISGDPKFSVRGMRGVSQEHIASYFLEVYNSAWGGHEGFKNMRIEQARGIIKSMKVIMDPDILIFAFMDDTPIGFYLSIPELNEFFVHVNGNLNWWGKLKFMYHLKFKKRHTMLGIVFGVSKAYQGKGVESALIKYCGEVVVPMGRYKDTILTWIGDFNPRMLKVIEHLDTELFRTLTTYRVFFDDSIPFERHPVLGERK